MTHAARPVSGSSRAMLVLYALQALAVASVLSLAWQFGTAGQLFGGDGAARAHGVGAIVLHVLTGLLTLAALAYWRPIGGPLWPAVVSALVFAASFVQAGYGARDSLVLHVPGAMVLTVGAVWVTAWSFLHVRR